MLKKQRRLNKSWKNKKLLVGKITLHFFFILFYVIVSKKIKSLKVIFKSSILFMSEVDQ